jgi:plasmid maintenance system antidote protein VapI
MVDNMIMKSITSRVVAQYIDKLWDDMDARIAARSYKESDELAAATKRRQELESMDVYAYAYERFGIGRFGLEQVEEVRKNMENLLETELEAAKAAEDAAQKNYDAVSGMDDSDISHLINQLAEIKPELGERLREILGEYYKFGETSNKELSALQQGISGITEDTAGALEAYMNGVSQQVYLQSDYLRQIVDILMMQSALTDDAKVATLSQILLQLQSSYQTQEAIRGILEGWSSPNGLAVRVEMN